MRDWRLDGLQFGFHARVLEPLHSKQINLPAAGLYSLVNVSDCRHADYAAQRSRTNRVPVVVQSRPRDTIPAALGRMARYRTHWRTAARSRDGMLEPIVVAPLPQQEEAVAGHRATR